MDGYVLSIDQGTGSTKVLIFDRQGHAVSCASRAITSYRPAEGWFEEDPEEMWLHLIDAAGEAFKNARILPEDIAAIGICNQQGTTVAWDSITGQAIGRAIVWQDRRTQEICERWTKGKFGALDNRVIGSLVPNLSCTKYRWLLENDHAVQKALSQNRLKFGTIDSWLVWKLSGGRAHITDPSNAYVTGLLGANTRSWDERLLSIFSIPRELLPEIRSSSEVYAYTEPGAFFSVHIPISACVGDQSAATLGQACVHPGMLKNTMGTGAFMVRCTGPKRLEAHEGVGRPILWERGDNGPVYGLETYSDLSGEVLSWIQSHIGIIDDINAVDGLALQVPDSGGVYFIPAMIGMHMPLARPSARGAVLGINLNTTKQHLVRAALESLAYQSRDALETMQHAYSFTAESIRVDGGCAKSDFLLQFTSDILGIPVERPAIIEASALGAAFLAGLAVGYWASEDDALSTWHLDLRFEPRIPASRRAELYGGWLEALELAGAWKNRETLPSIPWSREIRLDVLSPREAEVMRLIIAGYSMHEISERLHTSIKTVEKQRHDAVEKLGAHSLASAIGICVRLGMDTAAHPER